MRVQCARHCVYSLPCVLLVVALVVANGSAGRAQPVAPNEAVCVSCGDGNLDCFYGSASSKAALEAVVFDGAEAESDPCGQLRNGTTVQYFPVSSIPPLGASNCNFCVRSGSRSTSPVPGEVLYGKINLSNGTCDERVVLSTTPQQCQCTLGAQT